MTERHDETIDLVARIDATLDFIAACKPAQGVTSPRLQTYELVILGEAPQLLREARDMMLALYKTLYSEAE